MENCNTEEARAASVWQMLADKWNDESFVPATASEPDWHPHFASSETITYEMVSEFLPPNAEKVRDRFESMMTVLKRTIPKFLWFDFCLLLFMFDGGYEHWLEYPGGGDGGLLERAAAIGHLHLGNLLHRSGVACLLPGL